MSRLPRVTFALLEAVLLLSIPIVGYLGFRAVLDTTGGRVVDPELDPHEPGYEAAVAPTPVELVVTVDAGGALAGVTVLVLSGTGEAGGSIVFLPVDTVVHAPFLERDATLREAYATGEGVLTAAVGRLLDVGFSEVRVLTPDRLADLVAPAAPIGVTNGDALPGFPAGDLALTATAVPGFLEARAPDESELAVLARHESIWRSWLGAIAASADPGVVPGEAGTGIARFLRGLAAGPVTYDVIPVTETPIGLAADPAAVQALVNDRVPFPAGFDVDSRARLRVLDGIGADGLVVRVARDAIVGAGVQLAVIGNADRFGLGSSEVVYFEERFAGAAVDVAAALGIESVRRDPGPNPNDQVDLTVVVGTDLGAAYGVGPDDVGGGSG